jgi:hypothetical protein
MPNLIGARKFPLKEIFQITKGIFHQVCSTFERVVELKKEGA